MCEVHKRQEMGRIINRTRLLGFTAVKHGNSCPQSNTTTLQRVANTGGWQEHILAGKYFVQNLTYVHCLTLSAHLLYLPA